jgi:anaphase-promoting complex subunit 1
MESLPALAYLSRLYLTFTNPKVKNTRNRATRGIAEMVRLRPWEDFSDLPLGVAMPLLEGVRTMQLVSFIDWSYDGYKLIKRDDLAENLRPWSKAASEASYMSIKQTLVSDVRMSSIALVWVRLTNGVFQRTLNDRVIYQPLIKSIRNAASGETSLVSGVELGHSGIAEACFGADRRLEEVARMLSSSSLQIAKMLERPDAR